MYAVQLLKKGGVHRCGCSLFLTMSQYVSGLTEMITITIIIIMRTEAASTVTAAFSAKNSATNATA